MDDAGTRAHWQRLQELFEEGLSHAPDSRASWLEAAVADPDLRARVGALLAAHEGPGPFDSLSDAVARVGLAGVDGAEPPAKVGPYRVLRELGSGGMASVYLARHADRPGSDTVAVKVARPAIDSDRIRRRFVTEQRLVAGLEHPCIARFLDQGVTDDGALYLVTEYVDGLPIDRHCDRERLPVQDRVRIILQICDAVAYAHGLGVVHRDIKPANVLVTADGRPRLLDFGIAKILADGAFAPLHRKTSTGVSLATFQYASPEQLLGRPVTVRSDIHQLGSLLYRLVTGSPPPLRAKVQSRAKRPSPAPLRPSDVLKEGRPGASSPEAIAEARATTVDDLIRDLRRGLDRMVVRACREEPARRYPTVEDLADDLRSWLEGGWGPGARLRRLLRALVRRGS